MYQIFLISLKGVLRDKFYHGILFTIVLFLGIPLASTFSLRQVAALATTLSISLTSFILLLIAVFLGGTFLWKDMDRRYVYSTLGMPLSRSGFIIGKYLGISSFLIITALVLGVLTIGVVSFSSATYPPDRSIALNNIAWTILFAGLKYCLLISVSFVFACLSTSYFLPIFGSIAIFYAGSATQEVFDYLQTVQGQNLSTIAKALAQFLYYVLPNFSAFDLSSHAIYGIPLNTSSLLVIGAYGLSYICIMLGVASLLFSRRDMQ